MAVMDDNPPVGVEVDATEPATSEEDESPFAILEAGSVPEAISGETAEPFGAATAETLQLDLVLDIPVRLSVELGRTEIPIRDVVTFGRGSTIELDRNAGEPLDVRINGVLIGRGEVVVINEERLGLRFTEVVSEAERVKRLARM